MAGVAPTDLDLPDSQDVLFTSESDLTSSGHLGSSRLVVTGERVYRYEKTPLGEQLADSWPTKRLSRPEVEDLVDATALVAHLDGIAVELFRATSARNLQVAYAAKRLKAIVAGEPVPELDEHLRICPKCSRPLPEDSDICLGCINRGKTLIRLFAYMKPYRLRLVWGTLLTLAGTLSELAPPFLAKLLIDDVLTQRKTYMLGWILGSLVASRVLIMGVQIGRGRNVAYLSSRVAVAIRTSLFHRLQQLSLAFYDKRNVGSIMSRMTNDTGALYDVLVDGVPVVLNQGALLVGIPVAMLLLDWKIALLALLPVPFVMIGVRLFRRSMMRVWSRFWHAHARMSSTLNGILQGTRVVKAFRGEGREEARFGRRIGDVAHAGYTAEMAWSSFFPVVVFTMSFSTIAIWWFGGRAVLDRQMSLGELTAFISYVALLSQPIMMLQRLIDWTSRSLTAAERVFEVMDTPLDVADDEASVPMPELEGRVVFRDVHFGYEKAREIIHGIDLDVRAGEIIGLVGHSGAGKSTLINLLLRFYDPTQGAIEVDGVDLRRVRLEDFRRQVGVVLQDSYLFPGSIRHNIAYGRPEAGLEEIIEAAMAANAHEFIVAFPDGYDTYVGERGHRLSGGERQRIAIARAILHNPRILILDEATASVDTQTERMIQEGIERLVSGRTVFAIAHRLSTLRNADRLVVLEHGKVAEIGRHDELLAKEGGIYAKLVEMQREMNKVHQEFVFEEAASD